MRSKDLNQRIREKREDVMDKIKTDVPKYPDPLPQNVKLFDHIAKKYKNHRPGKEKGPHFGLAPRFEKSELEKWKKQIKIYNDSTEGEPINIKKGNKPGPGAYNILERWKGKKVKGKAARSFSAEPKVGQRILKMTSKLPTRSIYHPRRL